MEYDNDNAVIKQALPLEDVQQQHAYRGSMVLKMLMESYNLNPIEPKEEFALINCCLFPIMSQLDTYIPTHNWSLQPFSQDY